MLNMSYLVPRIHVPRNLNNQVETNMNLISSHSTLSRLHAKNPNVLVKPQTRFKQKVQLKHITTLATVLAR